MRYCWRMFHVAQSGADGQVSKQHLGGHVTETAACQPAAPNGLPASAAGRVATLVVGRPGLFGVGLYEVFDELEDLDQDLLGHVGDAQPPCQMRT